MMQGSRVAAMVGAMLSASALPNAAQQPPPAPPEAVAHAVVRADSAGDWAALLALAHPDALHRFRSIQIFQLRMLSSPDWAIYDSLVGDSALQASWQRSSERRGRILLDSVFQVPTVDSLAHTSSDSVFARFIRWVNAAPRDTTEPQLARRPAAFRIVGAVRASDTLAYVVMDRPVEQPLGPMPDMFRDYPHETHEAEVMVMRRLGKEWKSMLDGFDWGTGFNENVMHEE